jgi:glycosyltransferase involved in cell wall biosynthesis
MAPKVLHLSTYATNGGAARAATALHEAMLAHGVESEMWTAHGSRFKRAQFLDRQIWRLQSSPVKTWRSPARFGSLSAREINASDADIVNLHWVTDGFLSIEEIGKIEKPIVWSMYDMWPFSGTEHYGTDAHDARWRAGYTRRNRPSNESGLDMDHWSFDRKRRSWGHQTLWMVPASEWLAEDTKGSALLRTQPVTRIPHVVDTSIFAPMERAEARAALVLPPGPVVLFLASAGIGDERKGWDLLEPALMQARHDHPSLQVLVVGPKPDEQSRVAVEARMAAPIRWHGPVATSDQLRTLYSASDVVAVPSREDNMPLTAMEAHACGRPVVGFHVGGLPDIVDHEVTGHLARPFDSVDFAAGLCLLLERSTTGNDLAHEARARALQVWSPDVVVPAYLSIYETAL